jgi:hypothetical protein
MRSHVAESFTRGMLRIVGTVVGAGARTSAGAAVAAAHHWSERRTADRGRCHAVFRHRRQARLCLVVHRPHLPDGADRRHGTCAGTDSAFCIDTRSGSARGNLGLRGGERDLHMDGPPRTAKPGSGHPRQARRLVRHTLASRRGTTRIRRRRGAGADPLGLDMAGDARTQPIQHHDLCRDAGAGRIIGRRACSARFPRA